MGYKILIIRGLKSSLIEDLVGCILYLLKENQRNGRGYVPYKFIYSLSPKIKFDIIKHLINNDYIIRYRPKEYYELDFKITANFYIDWDELNRKNESDNILEDWDVYYNKDGELYFAKIVDKIDDIRKSNIKFLESGKKEWEKKPNLYIIKDIVYKLKEGYSYNGTERILKNIHHLNEMSFNHYYYNYRNITIKIPPQELLNVIKFRTIFEAGKERMMKYTNQNDLGLNKWGNSNLYEYDLTDICSDDTFGSHRNFFTAYGYQGLKHSSLKNPILVGPKYADAILLADQLLKTYPDNEITKFFKKRKYDKPLIVKKGKKVQKLAQHKEPLFYHWKDYEFYSLFDENKVDPKMETYLPLTDIDLFFVDENNIKGDGFGELRFKTAIYGWDTISQFLEIFPKTWYILHKIKGGKSYVDDKGTSQLNKFCKGIYPVPNLGSPILKVKDPSKYKGRPYYKIINYVIRQRENQIMKQIWKRLRSIGVLFVPIGPYVAVSKENFIATHRITEDVWCKENRKGKRYIDESLEVLITEIEIK